jgi:hypothetical protein
LPNRTRTFPRAFPPSFVAYFASRRDVNFNFAGLRALSHAPTHPLRELNILEGEIARRYCDIYWKTCKGAKYKYRPMVRAIMRLLQHQKEQSTTLIEADAGKTFFSLSNEMYNRRKVMPSSTCFWLNGMPIFAPPLF